MLDNCGVLEVWKWNSADFISKMYQIRLPTQILGFGSQHSMDDLEFRDPAQIQSTLYNLNYLEDRKNVRITEIRIMEGFVGRFSRDLKICSN